MKETYKPGSSSAPSGSYTEVGPRGGEVEGGRTAKVSEGSRMPPTSKKGNSWAKDE